jgi:fructose-bisphosphate aldolase class 1
MNSHRLIDTATEMVAGDKGLLAMDESNPTCNKRFAALGIPQTEERRRAYRELIVTTPGLGECISGAILYDETIRQQTKDGTPFVEIIMDGEHTLERCRAVTEEILREVFDQLYTQRVTLEGMILKPNMVLPGLTCAKQETASSASSSQV